MSREASNYSDDGALMFEWGKRDAKAICSERDGERSINENAYIKSYRRTKSS